jgi:hypothetical protein
MLVSIIVTYFGLMVDKTPVPLRLFNLAYFGSAFGLKAINVRQNLLYAITIHNESLSLYIYLIIRNIIGLQ